MPGRSPPPHLEPAGDGSLPLCAALPLPATGLRAVVVMPVRNEAEGIVDALAALASQVDSVGRPLPPGAFEVLVLANNCDDDTALRAHRFADAHVGLGLHVLQTTLPQELANVGYVRRQLFEAACRRLESAGSARGFVASTDGDTRVAPDWLQANLEAIDAGADAVGGRILTDDRARPSPTALRLQRLDMSHALLRSRLASLIDPDSHDPWPRHHQHFGASLAVTAQACRAVGGVPKVPYLEDMALVRALQRADSKLRHAPTVRVTTSSRLDGRAEVGLAWQLRQWADPGCDAAEAPVEPLARQVAVLQARRRLRAAWHGVRSGQRDPDLQAVTASLDISSARLQRRLVEAEHFGALWDDLHTESLEQLRRQDGLQPMSRVVDDLRRAVRQLACAQGASSAGGAVPAASNTSIR